MTHARAVRRRRLAAAAFADLARDLSSGIGKAVAVPGLVVLCAGAAWAVAAWPAATVIGAGALVILALSWREPRLALTCAILAYCFEGTVKILLTNGGSPFASSGQTVGAGALDLALFGATAGMLARDRGSSLRIVWSASRRLERTAMLLFGGWLALSVLQIAQSGHPVQGLEGFRLTQAYVLIAVAALAAYRGQPTRAQVLMLLITGVVAAGYATLRIIIGPAPGEKAYALAQNTVSGYGTAFRAVGSFSGSVGLISLLTPVAVFAVALALFGRHDRILAGVTAGLAIVGIVGSYGRAPLLAAGGGLVLVVAVGAWARGVSPHARRLAVGAMIALLLAGGLATVVAARASPVLRERVRGILHPGSDSSIQLRLHTWSHIVRQIEHQPLGAGLGTVGRATARDGQPPVTADNSYLKIFREQGIAGGLLFLGGVLAACVAIVRRLRRRRAQSRALGLSALGAFVAFLLLMAAGEYVEQPGKVFAWAMFGVAVAQAFSTSREPSLQ